MSAREERLYSSDRTAAISDGVFAVALTLLVLDIKPPEGAAPALVSALVAVAPQLGIFALSFAIVSYYWIVHHLIFASLGGVTLGLMWANLVFLFTVVVLPFSTAVLGRYPLGPPALAIYGANLAACTLTLAIAWYVADRTKLIEQLKPGQRRYTVLRLATQSGFSLLGVACAFAYPWLALTIFVATPVVYALTYQRSYW
jgi:uncharacterized membrane protein